MNDKQQKSIDAILSELDNVVSDLVCVSERIRNLEDDLKGNGNSKTSNILRDSREIVDKIANVSLGDEVMKTLCKVQISTDK